MSVLGVFDQRFRGFRVIEIGGVGVLLALILLVYLAKTIAGSESAEIDHVQQQIGDERARVTLLRAEVASLEQPERLETLSNRYLGLQPVDAKHDIDAQALATIAGAPAPKPQAPAQGAAPQATTPTPTPTGAPIAVAAQPDAARPVRVAAVAAQKPAKLAAVTPTDAGQAAAVEPLSQRPSELKAPAGDPIGALVQAPPDAPADAPR
ncbi:MAG TPA: hypothetical protein VGL73_06225 [Caulobacteraceae bacterium]|jgi:hypothetical protein